MLAPEQVTPEMINDFSREIARDDYAFYAEYVHRGLYQHAEHTELICRKLEEVERGDCTRLIICLPPRHSKSMTVSETFPSWFLGRDPNRRVIEVSYGDSLARRFGRENKKKIDEFGQEIFGIQTDRANASNNDFGISGYRGGMISKGIGAGITGVGADLLVVDDPIKNRKEALSKTYRDMIWNEWQNTLLTRLHPGGRVIVILTRWTEDDLVGRLLEEEPGGWEVISLPAEAEEHDLLGRAPGEPLWPERFDKTWLENTKKSVGSVTWASLYQQSPAPLGGQIIQRDWFRYYRELPGDVMELMISVDCAFKDLETSDYVVAQVWGKAGANRYLIDQIRDRMGIRATMDAIRQLAAKYPAAHTKLVEDKANGSAVVEMLKNEISGIIPVSPKESKESRVFSVAPAVEAGNVYLPDPSIAPWVKDFVDEVATFPSSRNDDQVDAFTQALIRWQQTPGLFIGRA